jgi:hypothetical protein
VEQIANVAVLSKSFITNRERTEIRCAGSAQLDGNAFDRAQPSEIV